MNLCSCDCGKQGLDFGYHCIQCCPLKVLLDDYSSFGWHCNIIVWCVRFMMPKIDSDLPWTRVINFTTWNPETTVAIVVMHSQCVAMFCTFFRTWARFLLLSAILQTPVSCLMPTHKKLVFLHSSISCMVSLYICIVPSLSLTGNGTQRLSRSCVPSFVHIPYLWLMGLLVGCSSR